MKNIPAAIPLTKSQTLILTGQLLQPEEPLYNMALGFRVRGVLNIPLFRQAFAALVAGCDSLRTIVLSSEDTWYQSLLPDFTHAIELIDFSCENDPYSAASQWMDGRSAQNFSLDKCLFDSVLLRLGEDDHIWYLNQHHIMTDAWSMQVLYRKQQELYVLARDNRLEEAGELPHFWDYVARESEGSKSPGFDRARTYWQEQLAIPAPPSQFYRQTPERRSGRTRRLYCQLGQERSKALINMAGSSGFQAFTQDLSLMQLFSTVLLTYLYRMTGNGALSLGTPSHSRTSPVLKETAGLLIEIFPLKVQVEAGETFESLYRKVAKANQNLLMHSFPGATDFEHSRAFDVLLNYIPSSFGKFDGMPVESHWFHPGYGDRNHLLRLQVHNFDQAEEFSLHFDLNEEVFVGEEQQWVTEHFLLLLDELLLDPGGLLARPSLMPTDWVPPYSIGISDWDNAPQIDKTVIDCLTEQAKLTPHAPALFCRGETVSYCDLDDRSTRLAGAILGKEIQAGDVVAVCMRRSIEAVISILAVMKSGAVLLPVDPAYPPERIDFILKDAQTALLIDDETQWQQPESISELLGPTLNDTAYVIYTSGSTGTPKGVVVGHHSFSNYIQWASGYYLDGTPLDFPLFSSLSFDLTLTSLLVPLVSGGQLVIYPEPEHPSEILIRTVIEDNRVDVIKLTPAHLLLTQSMDFSRSRIKKLIVGGDDFKVENARTLSSQFGDRIDIYNEYGPTEGTVACTVHQFSAETDQQGSVPIGKPISNAIIHIVDEHMNPVPQGVTGELYIGGAGVARGYLNRESLTKERFVDYPGPGVTVLYRTGDLARFNEKAQIEYLGRNDHQVKIRGVRIETSEVEALLLGQPGITDVVVDVAHAVSIEREEAALTYCARCGLAGNHPSAQLDDDQVCRICRIYERDAVHAQSYFRSLDDLDRLIEKIKRDSPSKQNCIMLLSGGKDSSYALCRLVDMGLTPLVFTLDNGYISEGAKANIQRLVDRLGLELVVGQTSAMDDIFVDSLTRHSNVCNGCFKTIYTLSVSLAHERGIQYICTGLSRGQIFESRVAHLFQQGIFDPAQIDRHIIQARKAYHRTDDIIARSLDVEIFQSDEVFESVHYLDFYRYTDVTLSEMLEYLNTIAPWIRPSDTGRSTNCLINDAGIAVHKKERGYHNYALPYSWDVRLGHKERDAALDELNDDLDDEKVARILKDVGYQPSEKTLDQASEDFLVAYYVSAEPVDEKILRERLRDFLPAEFIPRFFVCLDELPLTKNGKVDRQALPQPELLRRSSGPDYVPPNSDTEMLLANIWSRMLALEDIGVRDNFFELGGDSITNIQIVAAARECGLSITPQQIFDYPTIRDLALVAGRIEELAIEQGPVVGETLMLPSQLRHLESGAIEVDSFNQSVLLECKAILDGDVLKRALVKLLEHHDALRSSFQNSESGWQQRLLEPGEVDINVKKIELTAQSLQETLSEIEEKSQNLFKQLDVSRGDLIVAAEMRSQSLQRSYLLLVVNHLVIDGVSWWILLSDLEALMLQIAADKPIKLPPKSTSVQQWAHAISTYAETMEKLDRHRFWLKDVAETAGIPHDQNRVQDNLLASSSSISVSLSREETRQLIQDVPGAYGVQVPEVVLTALLKSLLAWSRNQALHIDIEGHGREDPIGGFNLVRTVAWFTSIFPVSLALSDTGQLGTDLKLVKEHLRSIPLRGVEYGILRFMSANPAIKAALESQPKAEVLFNYMGQWEKNLSPYSQFKFARPIELFRGAEGARTHLLEINAMIFDGSLNVEWTFSSNVHDAALIESLAAQFLQYLRELISYCVTTEDSSLTPVDFPAADLDQSDLDQLLSEFGE